jgi:hypothetical protein
VRKSVERAALDRKSVSSAQIAQDKKCMCIRSTNVRNWKLDAWVASDVAVAARGACCVCPCVRVPVHPAQVSRTPSKQMDT